MGMTYHEGAEKIERRLCALGVSGVNEDHT